MAKTEEGKGALYFFFSMKSYTNNVTRALRIRIYV